MADVSSSKTEELQAEVRALRKEILRERTAAKRRSERAAIGEQIEAAIDKRLAPKQPAPPASLIRLSGSNSFWGLGTGILTFLALAGGFALGEVGGLFRGQEQEQVEKQAEPLRQTVLKPVTETRMREETYTVEKPVTETVMRDEEYTVERPVTQTVIEEETYTVRRPVYETDYRNQVVTVMRPQTEKTYCTQRVVVPRWTLTQDAFGGWSWTYINSVETRYRPVLQTRMRPVQEVRKTPITTRRVVEEERTRKVPVEKTTFVKETKVRKVPTERIRYVEEERTRQVPETVTRYVREEQYVVPGDEPVACPKPSLP